MILLLCLSHIPTLLSPNRFDIEGLISYRTKPDFSLVEFDDPWGFLPSISSDASALPLQEPNIKTASEEESDQALLTQAEAHAEEQRLLVAARLLAQVKDPERLEDHHIVILEKARLVESLIQDHTSTLCKDGWIYLCSRFGPTYRFVPGRTSIPLCTVIKNQSMIGSLCCTVHAAVFQPLVSP